MKKSLKVWMIVLIILAILAVSAIYIFAIKDKSMTVYEIDRAVEQFENISLDKAKLQNVSTEYLEKGAEEYLDITGESTVQVYVLKDEIKTVGLRIAVMPVADVLNNEIYYFNKYGTLMLYESQSVGVGGSVKYYFSNDKLIAKENNLQEIIEVEFEAEQDILDRADEVYKLFE